MRVKQRPHTHTEWYIQKSDKKNATISHWQETQMLWRVRLFKRILNIGLKTTLIPTLNVYFDMLRMDYLISSTKKKILGWWDIHSPVL